MSVLPTQKWKNSLNSIGQLFQFLWEIKIGQIIKRAIDRS